MAAFVIPLVPNKVGAWRTWIHELHGPRKEEFEDFNERMQLTAHRVWLSEGAQGPLAIVIHEGPGASTFMESLAASQHPFDRWFRERISEYHGIDFSQPRPTPSLEMLLDWHVSNLADISG